MVACLQIKTFISETPVGVHNKPFSLSSSSPLFLPSIVLVIASPVVVVAAFVVVAQGRVLVWFVLVITIILYDALITCFIWI